MNIGRLGDRCSIDLNEGNYKPDSVPILSLNKIGDDHLSGPSITLGI